MMSLELKKQKKIYCFFLLVEFPEKIYGTQNNTTEKKCGH